MKRFLIFAIALLAIGIGWYLFRPERLFVNKTVNESLPGTEVVKEASATSQPTVLASGSFHGVAHDGKGTATILQLPDGKRVLRFTGFETSNGPDVQVYLVAAPDASDNDTVTNAGFIHVAALKGNIGDQNYDLPSEVDLNTHRAVTIWCRRFGVNFATAPLTLMGKQAEKAMDPLVLATGQFHDVAHKSVGTATVLQLSNGKKVLRFTDFETSNGPDVQVYLVKAKDATDNDTVTNAGFIHVGALKGNVGDQNYELPASVDLDTYQAVTIWCRRFGVNFGTAPLTMQHS